jgi:adenylate cyclase
MGLEIERKFLVNRDAWRPDRSSGIRYRQGYLSTEPNRIVRVRTAGDEAFLTIKGMTHGIERLEFEYAIPVPDAIVMLDQLCSGPLIEKIRYRQTHAGRVWEIDEFAGVNAGLIVAEVEIPAASTIVELPPWVGREVSDDPRYFNANLVRHPFSEWDHDP